MNALKKFSYFFIVLGLLACTGKFSTLRTISSTSNAISTSPSTSSPGTLSAASILRTKKALSVLAVNCASCHSGLPNSPTGTISPSSAIGSGGPALGAASNGQCANYLSFDYFSDVKIAEVIFYNRLLTLSERSSIECYLSGKYGLSVSENCSGGISPETLTTGLQQWLKADEVSSTATYADGASLRTWNDMSGHQYDMESSDNTPQTGGLSGPNVVLPTFIANAINSLPAISFNGTQVFDNTRTLNQNDGNPWGSPNVFYLGGSELTATIVYQSLNPNSSKAQSVWSWSPSSTRFAGTNTSFGFFINPGTSGGNFSSLAMGDINSVTQINNRKADSLWHIHTAAYTSGSFNTYQDGNLINAPAFGNFSTDNAFVQSGLVIPGNPSQSLLYKSLINYGSIGRMPLNASGDPGIAISAGDEKFLNDWITQMGNP